MIVKRIRFYSDREKKEKRIKLSDIESHRGLGRSLLLGGLQGAVGGYAGKNEADKADEEGASDSEIIRRAGKKGLKIGAATGAGLGAISYLPYASLASSCAGGGAKGIAAGIGTLAGGTMLSSGVGALGGHLGAKKNARTRTEKRRLMESSRR